MRTKVMVVLCLVVTLLSACAHMAGDAARTSASPTIDRIQEREELVVGTAGTMPPLNMTTKEGKIIGFEADLARYIAAGMEVELRIEAMPFSELLPALESGKIDMIISGMTITPKRNLRVAFVGPYFITGKAFLTNIEKIASAKEPTEINSPKVTLAALRGSTSQEFVEKLISKAKLITTKDYDEAVELVIQGKVHALVADYPICVVSLLRYPDKGLISLITPITYEPLGIALPANDPLLINWMENLLGILKETGRLEKMEEHWLEGTSWLKKLQ